MQNGISTRDVEVGLPFHPFTHALNVGKHCHKSLPRHFDKFRMPFRENVAVLATLVAFVGDMPLKCEIIHKLTCRLFRKPNRRQPAFQVFLRVYLPRRMHFHKQQVSLLQVYHHFHKPNRKLPVSPHSSS